MKYIQFFYKIIKYNKFICEQKCEYYKYIHFNIFYFYLKNIKYYIP